MSEIEGVSRAMALADSRKMILATSDASELHHTSDAEWREYQHMAAAAIATMADYSTLDEAHEAINAIGGAVSDDDQFGRGINHAVAEALKIIEGLGGLDQHMAGRIIALEDGLRRIRDRHLPDQPATDGGTEYEWAVRQYGELRRMAAALLSTQM